VPALLRSVWDEPGPAAPPARLRRDGVLVAVLAFAVALEGALRPDLPWRAQSSAVLLGLLPTLLWRRARPLPMVVVTFVVIGLLSVVTGGAAPQLYTGAYVLVLAYALFRWGSGRQAVTGALVMMVQATGTGVTQVTGVQAGASDVAGGFAVLVSAMAVGAVFRYRAGARTRELDQVKLLERAELARDLHDTVAHHVSAIAIRAQAGLAMAEQQPQAAPDALRVIEAEASRTLTEMRGIVRALRGNEPAELVPHLRVADLGRLADPSPVGPTVDVQILGDVDGLPPSLASGIYRLAQESVTNARRHAHQVTRIEISVIADDTSVRLQVRDDGDATRHRRPVSPGYGLLGMAERAQLLGGNCQAGPSPDHGWTVTAVLPRRGAARPGSARPGSARPAPPRGGAAT
jgi:signal transduction histidine kinase